MTKNGYLAATGPTKEQFTGKERDTESGLDYFKARYFSGAQGRFTSPDAAFADQNPGDPQSWNLYSYVRNNPLKFVDPTGQDCILTNQTSELSGHEGMSAAECSPEIIKDGPKYVQGTKITVTAPQDKVKYDPASPGPTPGQEPVFTATGTATTPKNGTTQTFSQCMATYANDFSIAGTLNHTYNAITGGNSLAFQNNLFAQAVLGNPITTFAYGSATDNAGTAASLAPAIVQMGMGTAPVTAGEPLPSWR